MQVNCDNQPYVLVNSKKGQSLQQLPSALTANPLGVPPSGLYRVTVIALAPKLLMKSPNSQVEERNFMIEHRRQ